MLALIVRTYTLLIIYIYIYIMILCERVWEKGPYGAKFEIEEVSRRKIISPIFVFCRISFSDPYSTSMPNFKCQNNLKDSKRAMKRQATFYSLHSRNTINGEWAEFQTSS